MPDSQNSEFNGDDSSAWAQMYHYLMHNREMFLEHYHKRSDIETAVSMIKGKFGSALRSKRDTEQINEALYKVLAHNICVLIQATLELGVEPVFCGDYPLRTSKHERRPQALK